MESVNQPIHGRFPEWIMLRIHARAWIAWEVWGAWAGQAAPNNRNPNRAECSASPVDCWIATGVRV